MPSLGQSQQLWCTGPAILYVGVGGSLGQDVPVQIGTAEARPTIVTYDEWLEAFNDLGGVKVPFDDSWQGEFSITRADLTRWDEGVLARIQSRPDFTGTRGQWPFGAKGTLMKTERMYYPLWVKFPYQSKAAYTNMPAGYRFPVSWLLSPDTMPIGTEPRKVSVIFLSRSIFSPVDGSDFLYDFNMTGLPNLN
jgi:hypothetical protein